jgi:metal-responsive CopG/Arc/MetJ family transcriptional regulator
VVPPAYVQLYNPHSTPLYLKSSNFHKKFFEGTETADITLHNKSTVLSNTHTHTHTHMKVNTVCTEGGIKEKDTLFEKLNS